MDVDSWASRFHAAKSFSAVHASRMHYESSSENRLGRFINMTNYIERMEESSEDGEYPEDEDFEELMLIDRQFQGLTLDWNNISSIKSYVDALRNERLRLEARRGCSSERKQEGEEKSEVGSVIIIESSDNDEEPKYNIRSRDDNRLALDDSEGDEDAKSCFLCPFCYVDIEVPTLCNHLEEEHYFDLKNAVCPLCAANLGKDVIEHLMVQHPSSFKHRRKSQKPTPWNGSSAMKAMMKNGRAYAHESAPDPLLSPFICNVSFPDPNGIPQDVCSEIHSPHISNIKSVEPSSPPDEVCVQVKEEKRQRATFVQGLIASTIFSDL